MSGRRPAVRVTILGEEYSIRSPASEEHTRAVAAHVDKAVRHVMNGGLAIEAHKAAILAAMQITNELFEARESGADVAARVERISADARRWLPPAKRHSAGGSTDVGEAEQS